YPVAVMSATADSSGGELSGTLQRNAKPRKRHDFRHLTNGLYAVKHEARLSNIADYWPRAVGEK
ncbi:MAG: hypothetical protein WAN04_04700, partial [Candidatus Udaeobacter sp.]